MNKPHQFLPLLKHMLGFYRVGPLPLVLWLGVTVSVLFFGAVVFPMSWMEWRAPWEGPPPARGPVFTFDGLFSIGFFIYLLLATTYLPFAWLSGYTPLEFLFTRAIDRGMWLRAERTAVLIIAASPLILNLLLSPLAPKLTFQAASPGSTAAAAQQRYLNLFPGSATPGQPEQIVIHHGSEMFAAWLAWSGLAAVFLFAGYYSLAFTAWQRAGWHHTRSKWRPWLGTIMIFTPLFAPLVPLLFCAARGINAYEECFLFFAAHPVSMLLALVALILVVQPLSEHNIRRNLEFEFF